MSISEPGTSEPGTSEPSTSGPGTSGLSTSGPGTVRTRFLPLHEGLGFRLSRLARTIGSGWAAELATIGLTPPQAAVLRGVRDAPKCSLRALARVLATDAMGAKRCVDELEDAGLLRSAHRSGDRRPRTLTLTAAGRTAVEQIDDLVHLQQARFDAALGPKQRHDLDRALHCLESAIGLPSDPFATQISDTSPTSHALPDPRK